MVLSTETDMTPQQPNDRHGQPSEQGPPDSGSPRDRPRTGGGEDRVAAAWEALFDQLPIEASPDGDSARRAQQRALDAWERSLDDTSPNRVEPAGRLRHIGRILMKHKAPHWAAAAAIVVAVFSAINSNVTPALAVNALVQNLEQAKTAKFEMTVTPLGQPEQKMKAFYRAPSHYRQEFENGQVNIVDWAAGKMMGARPGLSAGHSVQPGQHARGCEEPRPAESIRDDQRSASQGTG